MTTSADHDQERRRSKSKVRAIWKRLWRLLVRPQTWTFLVSVGRFIAGAMWLYHWLTEHLRK